MPREHLKDTLRQLHAELESGQAIDPELQGLLKQLSQDVDQLAPDDMTVASETAVAPVVDEKQTLLDRLLGLTEEFEDSHPELAESIGRVASALSRIGI